MMIGNIGANVPPALCQVGIFVPLVCLITESNIQKDRSIIHRNPTCTKPLLPFGVFI